MARYTDKTDRADETNFNFYKKIIYFLSFNPWPNNWVEKKSVIICPTRIISVSIARPLKFYICITTASINP